ncbi:DUF2277 family protein [Mycobacterium sp.]
MCRNITELRGLQPAATAEAVTMRSQNAPPQRRREAMARLVEVGPR